MQHALFPEPSRTLQAVHDRLLIAYGSPSPGWRLDPVGQLVLGIVSMRTHDTVSLRAFAALARHVRGEWIALENADPATLEEIIAPVTFAEKKARWLPSAVRAIVARRGRLALDFLADWPVEAARAWLRALPGVGPKVANSVLAFSTLERPVLVVDTHHHRIARRLRLVPERADLAKATDLLIRQIPRHWSARTMVTHHVLMKRHGQWLCHHAEPDCASCCLRPLCPQAGPVAGAQSAALAAGVQPHALALQHENKSETQ